MAPTPVLSPGESHGRGSLAGCSPWGHAESDTTERPHFHFSLSRIGEGNGSPLQCSRLENPRDSGAWWAAVYGVAQSRTRLKRLGSSSSSSEHYLHGSRRQPPHPYFRRQKGGRKEKQKGKECIPAAFKEGSLEKWTDSMASGRHPCPTLSWPLRLGSVSSDTAGLGGPVPVCALGHESLLSCPGIPVVFEDAQLPLPRENRRVYSPHSSPSPLPAFLVVP